MLVAGDTCEPREGRDWVLPHTSLCPAPDCSARGGDWGIKEEISHLLFVLIRTYLQECSEPFPQQFGGTNFVAVLVSCLALEFKPSSSVSV